MSRGFVKEDDQEDIPFVPPRAYLPPGAVNYVTPNGMKELEEERQTLLNERDALSDPDNKKTLHGNNESERRVAINHINARLQLLDERIRTARIVTQGDEPSDVIRFGAIVELKATDNEVHTMQITGVDEADVSKGKLSFISPLARVLINKKAGDIIRLKGAKGEIVYEILSVKVQLPD